MPCSDCKRQCILAVDDAKHPVCRACAYVGQKEGQPCVVCKKADHYRIDVDCPLVQREIKALRDRKEQKAAAAEPVEEEEAIDLVSDSDNESSAPAAAAAATSAPSGKEEKEKPDPVRICSVCDPAAFHACKGVPDAADGSKSICGVHRVCLERLRMRSAALGDFSRKIIPAELKKGMEAVRQLHVAALRKYSRAIAPQIDKEADRLMRARLLDEFSVALNAQFPSAAAIQKEFDQNLLDRVEARQRNIAQADGLAKEDDEESEAEA